jgi:uncharacterized phage protein (TIGR02216 family)
MNTINWYQLMQHAVCNLGIPPQQFWSMTIKEFTALIQHYESNNESMPRVELENLQNQFPD